MPVVWNEQPYQLISELEQRYTQVLMSGTTRMLNQLAPEIETWMKQESIWQDQTGQARGSLQARVIQGPQTMSNPKYERGMAVAEQRDVKELSKINLGRKSGLTWGSRQPLMQVPRGKSSVAAFQGKFGHLQTIPAKPALIGTIRLGYGDEPGDVEHAIWLEIAKQGRYAIIARAIDYWGHKLSQRLKQVAHLVQFEEASLSYGDIVSPEQQFKDYVAAQERFGGAGSYKPFDPAVRKRYVTRKRRETQIRRQKAKTGTFQRQTRSDKGTRRK